jgi:hypothetical protein
MTVPRKLYSYTLVLFIITLLTRCVLITYYNNNMGGIETNVVYGIQRILLGQPLYRDPAAGTYAVIQYTPLHYYLAAAVAKLVGVEALNVKGIYTLCRILALEFNLLSVAVVAWIISIWGFTRRRSLLFATPVLIILTTHYFLRGDSLHLLFFASAFWAFIRYSRKQQLLNLMMAALLSGACVMSKQSGILVCGIIGLSLLMIHRRYWHLLIYSGVTFLCAAIIAWICIGGAWQEMYQNAYLGLKNGTDLSFLYRIFVSQFFIELVPCYFIGGIVVYTAVKKISDPVFRIVAVGIGISWLFAVITGLKIGSSNNYFMEFLVMLIIALPFLLESESAKQVLFSLFRYPVTIYRFACFALFVLVTSKTMGLVTAVYIDKSIENNKEQYTRDKALYDYFIHDLHLQHGEKILFTERNFLDNLFIDYAIMPTKDVVSETYLASATTYDYTAFSAGLNNGLVKYMVADAQKKDFNRWHEQLPFLLIDEHKFKWIEDRYGYAIYSFTP